LTWRSALRTINWGRAIDRASRSSAPDWDAGFEFSTHGAPPRGAADLSDFFVELFGGKDIPGEPPGDLLLTVQIAVPPADTPRAREIYETMARELAFDPRGGH
jgi:hypothetical protein